MSRTWPPLRRPDKARNVRFRLLALDIDGTLLDRDGRLLPSTVAAVQRARDAGIQPVLCTGRRYRRTWPVARELGLEIPMICNSGAVVKSPDGRSTLWRSDFDPDLALAILDGFDRQGHRALSFQDGSPEDPDFVVHADPSGCPLMDDYLRKNRPHGAIDPDWRDRIAASSHFHFCAFGDRDQLLNLENLVREALGDRVQSFVQKSPSYLGTSCEVLRGDANKWTAVLRMAASWGIAPEEICAVGDDMNDLPMIAAAGLGVAMGHAPDVVLGAADLITGDHDNDGVTALIDQVLLV